MSFGSGRSSSSTTDHTPSAFRNLQQPLADVFGALLGQQGNTTNPLGGMPRSGLPTAAPITGGESSIVQALSSMIGGTQNTAGQSQNFLLGLTQRNPGQVNPSQTMAGLDATGVTNPVDAPGFNPGSLGGFTAARSGALTAPGYDARGNNPFLRGAINAAQRSTMDNLTEVLDRSLPGQFTQAGQFTSPRGSSAFDRAAAIASRGAAQEMGDIASTISYQSFGDERNRQFQAQEAARAQESDAVAAELERRGLFGEAARGREFEAGTQAQTIAANLLDNALTRETQARENMQDRQVTAAQSAPSINETAINTMVSNLTAQALPRLIQQQGIEGGEEQFQNRINSLLTVLATATGATRPALGSASSSSQRSMSFK